MKITVRLLASFRSFLPEGHDERGGFSLEVAPGTTVRDVLRGLPLPAGEPSGTCTGAQPQCTFLVNGLHAHGEQVLDEGDVVTVFPAAGGG